MSIDDCPTLKFLLPQGLQYAPGRLIDQKYRLEKLLGQGAMGAVWQARNVRLDMAVALKLLHREVRGTEATQRLLIEARVAAKLCHPSVVRVFDCGEAEDGAAYIIMELLDGASLAALLERHGKLPAQLAVQLLLPIIDGLCACHRAGIVHRDVKPENIVVSQAGSHMQPKLLDFGIAKLHDDRCTRLTADGSLTGSPTYMAPEQARGEADVDQRADIWAACVVIYELVSGVSPFVADNQYAVLRAVVEREPAPLSEPSCATLWPILRRGLSKDRNLRFASARALGQALACWLISQGRVEDVCGEPLIWNWEVVPRVNASSPPFPREAPKLSLDGGALRNSTSTGLLAVVRGSGTGMLPNPKRWRSRAACALGLLATFPLLLAVQARDADVPPNPAVSAPQMAAQERARSAEPAANREDAFGSQGAAPRSAARASEQPRAAPEASSTRNLPARAQSVPTNPGAGTRRNARAPRREAAALGLKDPF